MFDVSFPRLLQFLPSDTRSAKRDIAVVSRPSVCPSVRDVEVPLSYRWGYLESTYN